MTATVTTLHPAATAAVEIDPEFAAFWKAYPNKTGKIYALQCWRKMAPVRPPIDQILRTIQWQRRSERWRNGYIPNPSTWINQGRWDDEPPEAMEDVPVQRVYRRGIDCCRWPECGHTGSMLDHQGWRYCEKHRDALLRGETPPYKRK